MNKIFHNTANSDNAEIHEAIKGNYGQNEAIKAFLKDNEGLYFTAWDIQDALNRSNKYFNKLILITSVRRALNSLERNGFIVKGESRKGKMKMTNFTYTYKVSEKKPLFCKDENVKNNNEPQSCKCGKKPIVVLDSEKVSLRCKIYIECATNTCDAYQGLLKIGGITALDRIILIKSWNKQDFTKSNQIKRTPEHGC